MHVLHTLHPDIISYIIYIYTEMPTLIFRLFICECGYICSNIYFSVVIVYVLVFVFLSLLRINLILRAVGWVMGDIQIKRDC